MLKQEREQIDRQLGEIKEKQKNMKRSYQPLELAISEAKEPLPSTSKSTRRTRQPAMSCMRTTDFKISVNSIKESIESVKNSERLESRRMVY